MWCPCSFKFRQALEMQTESGQAALPAGLQTHGVYHQAHVRHRCRSKERLQLQSSVDFYLQNQVCPWLPLLNFRNTRRSSDMGTYLNVNTMVRHNLLTTHHDLLNYQKNLIKSTLRFAGSSWRTTCSFHKSCNTLRTGTDYPPRNISSHLEMGAQFTTVYLLLATALLEQVLLSHVLYPPGWNKVKHNLYVLGRTCSAEDDSTGNCWYTGGSAFALLESYLLVGLQYNILTR